MSPASPSPSTGAAATPSTGGTAAPTPPASPSTGLRLLYVATLCNFTAFGIYFVALQRYVSEELDAGKALVGLSVGAFSLSAVLVRPFVGRGIDARGRRPFLLGALALLTLSSLAFLAVASVPAVVALRLVHGVAGGTFYTTAAAVTTDLAPAERRASAIARFSLFLYAGFAGGPALAEAIIDAFGFDAVWLTAAALGAVAAVCVHLLPESGGASMARRASLGPVTRRLLHPAAVGPGLVLLCTGMGYASVTNFSALYARHIGLGGSGGLYAAFAVTVIAVRLVSGKLADTWGRAAVALPGLGLAAAGLAVLAVVQQPVPAYVGVATFGAGFSLIFPALMAFTVDRVADHERGEALGSFTAFMDVGSGAGGPLIGVIAQQVGFGAAYLTPALLCVAGAVLLAHLARQSPAAAAADPGGTAEELPTGVPPGR